MHTFTSKGFLFLFSFLKLSIKVVFTSFQGVCFQGKQIEIMSMMQSLFSFFYLTLLCNVVVHNKKVERLQGIVD